MEIPPKVRIPLSIEQGSVYNFYIEFSDPKRQSKNRYFVVLNREPKTDIALIMVTSTTQILKRREFVRRSGIDSRTIVYINDTEYPVFNRDCCFDCNNVFEISLNDLIHSVETNGSANYPKLPAGLLLRLIGGVKLSPQVSEELKKLI
jgi:hypothetical protein